MTFTHPWNLLGLIPVAGVAMWSLLRPGRQHVVVGSLSLWRQALQRLESSGRRRTRRMTASWLLLLGGAVVAAIAAAGPVWTRGVPRRRISLVVCPSAELAGEGGMQRLRSGGEALLDRLGPEDRVRLVAPSGLRQDSTEELTPAEARGTLAALRAVPVAAADLVASLPSIEAGWACFLVPRGQELSPGPERAVVAVEPALPPATFSRLAATVDDGQVHLLASVRNHTDRELRLAVVVSDAENPSGGVLASDLRTVAAGRSEPGILTFPDGARSLRVDVHVEAKPRSGRWGTSGFLRRVETSPVRVALIGRDSPAVRRFVDASDQLRLAGDPGEADVVIAIAADAPDRTPALLIDPPTSPAGFRRGEETGPVRLSTADVREDELLQHVDLSAAAVRTVRPWVSVGDSETVETVLSIGQGALIVRRRPGEGTAGRVYVAMDLSRENTNLAVSHALLIFLANAIDALTPDSPREVGYRTWSPYDSPGRDSLEAIVVPRQAEAGPWPAPGLYRSPDGAMVAISLTGLAGGDQGDGVPSGTTAMQVALPEPAAARTAWPIWPLGALLAGSLWLAGWFCRAVE